MSAFKDLLFASRALTREPGIAAAAMLTVALGVGANTAIFSVVNGVLLQPLPYPGTGSPGHGPGSRNHRNKELPHPARERVALYLVEAARPVFREHRSR